MALSAKFWRALLVATLYAHANNVRAQDAKQIVQQAVNAELAANRDDHSHWRYMKRSAGGNLAVVVETEDGTVGRDIEINGKPATPAALATEDAYNERFIHEPAMRERQRKDGAHDERDATELLNLLPQAFTWKVESQTAETITLAFKPDPNFHPPDIEARVMGEMAGTLVVDKGQHRIRTMKGALTEEVSIGYGLVAKMRKGGTFDIERTQVAPGLWQITQTHVHIDGRALFFKTIGQQQDEVKTQFTPVPAGTTLEQAVAMLREAAK